MYLQRWALLMGVIACLTPWVMAGKVILCYTVAWAVTRPIEGRFSTLDADTNHCTHVVYAFMGLDKSTAEIVSIDEFIDFNKNGRGHDQLANLRRLKERNPGIKVLASIGGWNQKGDRFSEVASTPEKREKFIKSAVNFIRTYKLDGLDICWQFPGLRGGKREDKENSVTLFQELKNAFNREGWLLTVHIIGKRYVIDNYNIKAVSDIVDFINLAAVEYSGPWERKTGIMAPLVAKNELSVKFAVDYILRKGAAPEKVLLGLPTYGHAYVLREKPTDKLIGLFSNETFISKWTNEYGVIAYNEMCLNLKNEPGWVEVWDEGSQTPLAYNDKRFVSMDDRRTFLAKAALAVKKNLGGVMIWSIDMDDFRGNCHGVEFPQLKVVSDFLNGGGALPLSLPVQPIDDQAVTASGPVRKPIFCSIASWAASRPDAGKFSSEHIDRTHCTHIIYLFMKIDGTTSQISSDNNFEQTGPPTFRELRRFSPHLKVLVSIGGHGQDSVFSDIAASSEKRLIFINSIVQFLKRYDLHGVDIFWRFPDQQDRRNIVTLLQELRNAFNANKYILIVHIIGLKKVIESFDVKAISNIVDFINLAAFSYHGPWEKAIEATSPLTSSDYSNVRFSVDHLLEQGAPPNKVLLGLPTFGHSYVTPEEPRGEYFGQFFDHTVPSLWTNSPGLIGYNEVCYMDSYVHWDNFWEELSQTPIAYKGTKLISYDNVRSIKLKARIVRDKNLAGAMIWTLDTDDFRGLCNGGRYPLLSAIANEINKRKI